MSKGRPTYQELEKRLAAAEPIVEALQRHEVDAVVGGGKITLLLLQTVGDALVSSEAGFAAMFGLAGVGMVQADPPGFHFTKVNQKFCMITGYSGQELLSQSYLGLTHPRDHHRDLKTLAGVLRGQTDAWDTEKRIVRKDGKAVWVGIHGVALRDAAGVVVRILAMFTDLTAGKQAAQEHRAVKAELKKQVQELTAALPHGKAAALGLKKPAIKKPKAVGGKKPAGKLRPTRG